MSKKLYEENLVNRVANNLKTKSNFNEIISKVDTSQYINSSNKHQNKNSVFKFAIAICLIILLIPIGIIISINNNKTDFYSMENRKNLTRVVYNSAIAYEEEKIPQEVDNVSFAKSKNNYIYTDIKVNKSFKFDIVSNCSFTPFFENNLENKEIEVIIAELEFNLELNKYAKGWYKTEMIIISYENEIMGFLSPSMVSSEFNKEELITNYEFQSCSFITDEQIVKYYEKGDLVYNIDVDVNDINNIIMDIKYENALESNTIVLDSITSINHSYKTLNSEYTINLIENVKIEKVIVSGVITSIEENKLYVTSEVIDSIVSVTLLQNASIYVNGVAVELNVDTGFKLNIGDKIEFGYYKRFSNYIPKDIYVDYINVKRS